MSESAEVVSSTSFSSHPKNLEKYTPGTPVTRENFISMLLTSFYVAKSKVFRQQIFYDWIQSKTGFDHEKTFENFTKAGGWSCLSDKEQETFLETLSSIPQHSKGKGIAGNVLDGFVKNPNTTLEENLPVNYYRLDPNEKEDMIIRKRNFVKNYGTLSSMTFQEMVSNLNKFTNTKK